jgi:hypothetical protein
MLICTIVIACTTLKSGAEPSNGGRDKPWITDAASFLSSQSHQHCIIGRSSAPCLSEAEAKEQACADASVKVVTAIVLQLDVQPTRLERQQLEQRITAELQSGRLIEDRSLSVRHRPYGDIWWGAVLVDASPDRLRPIGIEYSRMLIDRRLSRARQLAAIAGMAAAIVFIYAVLNAVTKGYFRGRLRAIGAAALVLLIAMAWALIQ